MKFPVILALLAHAGSVLAADFCGQWDYIRVNNYILYNNLWGKGDATSGSQCTGFDSSFGASISWHTNWSWQGGQYNVKSFANANLVFTPKRLSDIRMIPSIVRYSYSGSGMVANVAYDIFLDAKAGSQVNAVEVMIWLAAYGGAGPISSSGQPVATAGIAGIGWKLYDGYNGSMRVFSFVSGSPVTNFQADTKLFLTYLSNSGRISSSLYVNTIQCGTEPFVGSNARLSVSTFLVAVN